MDYSSLSLEARLAIALRCFEDYCEVVELHHPEVTKMFHYLWGYFTAGRGGMEWKSWEQSAPTIARFDPAYPEDFTDLLLSKGTQLEEFQDLLYNTENTLFHTFYGGVDDYVNEMSLKRLSRVLEIVRSKGIEPINLPVFPGHHYSEDELGGGLSNAQLEIWRNYR